MVCYVWVMLLPYRGTLLASFSYSKMGVAAIVYLYCNFYIIVCNSSPLGRFIALG